MAAARKILNSSQTVNAKNIKLFKFYITSTFFFERLCGKFHASTTYHSGDITKTDISSSWRTVCGPLKSNGRSFRLTVEDSLVSRGLFDWVRKWGIAYRKLIN